MDIKNIKEIEEFFFDEEGRREFIELVVLRKDVNYFDNFLLKIEPFVKDFRDKSKLFFCYLWLSKSTLAQEDLPKHLHKTLVPALRLYEVETSGIRMGGKKRYKIETELALSIAREHLTNDDDFSKWLNNAFPSYSLKTSLIFFKYKEYYPFFKKRISQKLLVDLFWNKEILDGMRKYPDFAYTKDILDFEEKNRSLLLDNIFNSYIHFLNIYKFDYLSKDEKLEIFNTLINRVKKAVKQKTNYTWSLENKIDKEILDSLTILISGFRTKQWQFAWENYINSKEFEKWDLSFLKMQNMNTMYTVKNIIGDFDIFILVDYLLKMGLGKPSISFYDIESILMSEGNHYSLKDKLKIIYSLDEKDFNENNIMQTMIDPYNHYKNRLNVSQWYYLIPFESFVFLKKEFNFYLRIIDTGDMVWDESSKYMFCDFLYYSGENMELTEELRDILLLNYKH